MNSQTNLVTAICHTCTTCLLSWKTHTSPKSNVIEQNRFSETTPKIFTEDIAGGTQFLQTLFSYGTDNLWEKQKLKKVFSAFLPLAVQLLALLASRYKCHEGAVSKVTAMKNSLAVWLTARAPNCLVIHTAWRWTSVITVPSNCS